MDKQKNSFKCNVCGEEKNILFGEKGGNNICSSCLDKEKLDNRIFQEKNFELEEVNKNKLKNYKDILLESTKNFREFEGILKYLPDFYTLISNINSNTKSTWHTKMLVNAALSYLVLEKDLIPDKEGAKGYLDDLFICTYILKEIRDKASKKIILDNLQELDYDERILPIISDVFKKSSFYLGNKCEKIIKFVGLNKFTMFDLVYLFDESYHLKKAKEKQKIIYAMLAVKAEQIFKLTSLDKKSVSLKAYICTHPDFSEINRYMQYLKK